MAETGGRELVVDLIEGGLLHGDPVLVVASARQLEVLRTAWDDDPRITFDDAHEAYDEPMRMLAEFQRRADRLAGSGHDLRVTAPLPPISTPSIRRNRMSYRDPHVGVDSPLPGNPARAPVTPCGWLVSCATG